MGDHGEREKLMVSQCVADQQGAEVASFWVYGALCCGVLPQEGHSSSLDPAVSVVVHGCVGPIGCPRPHRGCLRRDVLVSVL